MAYYDEGEHAKVLPHAACLCLVNVKPAARPPGTPSPSFLFCQAISFVGVAPYLKVTCVPRSAEASTIFGGVGITGTTDA